MMFRHAVLCPALCVAVLVAAVLSAPASECPSGTAENQQVFVASDSNCAEFYLCSNGVPSLLTCPGDLYFNLATGRCDYRDNVDCDISASTAAPDTTTSPASSGEGPSPAERAARQVESDAGPVCPDHAGPYPVLLPNPSNCSTYYMCSGGVAVLMSCPTGLFFNNNTWTCDFPAHVDCPESYEAPAAVVRFGRFMAARSVSGGTPPPSDQCPKVTGKYPVLLPNPDDCGSFYMCSHGIAFLKRCPTNLLFNNDTWTCDYPQNVHCNKSNALTALRPIGGDAGRPINLKLTFDNGCPAVDGKYPVFLPNPKDCSTYLMCSHGVPYLYNCPPGLEFNNITWTCDFPWRARCTKVEGFAGASGFQSRPVKPAATAGMCPENDGKYPVFLPNPANCSTYYMCSNGVPYLYSCPGDLEFNSVTNTCDFSWRAGCKEIDETARTPGLPSRPVKTAVSDESCPAKDGKYPVFLPNPSDCSTYYMCSNGVPYLYSCPADLEFNSRRHVCDFSWRARCTEVEGAVAAKPELQSRLDRVTAA